MGKRALVAVAGFLGLGFSLFAEQTQRQDIIFRTLDSSSLLFPSLALSESSLFTFSSKFNWVQPTPDISLPASPPVDVLLPPIIVSGPPRNIASAASSKDDPSKDAVEVSRSNPYYAGGEVGALYGRSSGKYGVEVEQGYVIGEVGDDKFSITAGASYERWSGRVPRFGH